jgi:hypothetical protein
VLQFQAGSLAVGCWIWWIFMNFVWICSLDWAMGKSTGNPFIKFWDRTQLQAVEGRCWMSLEARKHQTKTFTFLRSYRYRLEDMASKDILLVMCPCALKSHGYRPVSL